MESFFNQNIWASGLVLCILVMVLLYFYYQKVKRSDNTLNQIVGKKWAVIIPILAMIILPIFSYFILVPIFAVGTSTIQTIDQAKAHSANSTNFLTAIYENWNNFWRFVYDKAQKDPKLAGAIISGNGLLILIAAIFNHNWILKDNTNTPKWTIADTAEIFGRKVARIFIGICGTLLTLSGIFLILSGL